MMDLSAFPKIGNMTSGGGLAAIFDGNPSTHGDSTGQLGWAGVDLRTDPQSIDFIRCLSGPSGWDGVAALNNVSIRLFGKNGSLPANATDGTCLEWLGVFKDKGVQDRQSLYAPDCTAKWDALWVTVDAGSGGQATLAGLELQEPVYHAIAGRRLLTRSANGCANVEKAGGIHNGFRILLELDCPAVVGFDARAELVHRADLTGVDVALSTGARVGHRFGASKAALAAASWEFGGNDVAGGNLMSMSDHYRELEPIGAMSLSAGFHEFTLRLRADSYQTSTNRLAALLVEDGFGLNCLKLDVDINASLIRA